MNRPSACQIIARVLLTGGVCLMATAASAQDLETTDVVIGTAKDPNLGAEIVVAREKGYFEEAGLNAEIRYFPSGGDLMAAVVAGDVHYGSSGATPITTLRGRPYPIKILAQISDISGAQQLIVKEGIETPAELEGKQVAIMKGTASELLFDSFVNEFGFDPSTVEMVTMGPTEMLSSFVRGDVDAIAVWEPHATRARKSGNGHVLVSGTTSFIPEQEGPRRIYGDHAALFAPEDVIADNPNTTRAVLEALARAVEFIEASPEDANQMLAQEFGMEPADMRDIMDVNDYTMVLDDTLVNDLDRLAEFLHSLGKIQTKPDAIEWIEREPLSDVRPDWVRLPG